MKFSQKFSRFSHFYVVKVGPSSKGNHKVTVKHYFGSPKKKANLESTKVFEYSDVFAPRSIAAQVIRRFIEEVR